MLSSVGVVCRRLLRAGAVGSRRAGRVAGPAADTVRRDSTVTARGTPALTLCLILFTVSLENVCVYLFRYLPRSCQMKNGEVVSLIALYVSQRTLDAVYMF